MNSLEARARERDRKRREVAGWEEEWETGTDPKARQWQQVTMVMHPAVPACVLKWEENDPDNPVELPNHPGRGCGRERWAIVSFP